MTSSFLPNHRWSGRALRGSVFAGVMVLTAHSASAQQSATEPTGIRVGLFSLQPGLTAGAGTDSNVFNSTDDGASSDVFTRLTGQVKIAARVRALRLSALAGGEYVHFQTFDNQSALNTTDAFRVDVGWNRLVPYVGYDVANVKERPALEVDTRVRRLQQALTGGVTLRLLAKTSIDVLAVKAVTRFADDAVFDGVNLRQTLDRDEKSVGVIMRHQLTPLTILTAEANRSQESFSFVPDRDSRSLRVVGGLELNTLALITGKATLGLRRFDAKNTAVPDYTGPIAAIDLGYTLLDRTRFSALVNRDLAYSYDVTEPYYVMTGARGAVVRRITQRWDLGASFSRQRLAYRQLGVGPAGAGTPHTDTVQTVGGDVRFRLAPSYSLSLSVERPHRTSGRDSRNYDALRTMGTLTYARQ